MSNLAQRGGRALLVVLISVAPVRAVEAGKLSSLLKVFSKPSAKHFVPVEPERAVHLLPKETLTKGQSFHIAMARKTGKPTVTASYLGLQERWHALINDQLAEQPYIGYSMRRSLRARRDHENTLAGVDRSFTKEVRTKLATIYSEADKALKKLPPDDQVRLLVKLADLGMYSQERSGVPLPNSYSGKDSINAELYGWFSEGHVPVVEGLNAFAAHRLVELDTVDGWHALGWSLTIGTNFYQWPQMPSAHRLALTAPSSPAKEEGLKLAIRNMRAQLERERWIDPNDWQAIQDTIPYLIVQAERELVTLVGEPPAQQKPRWQVWVDELQNRLATDPPDRNNPYWSSQQSANGGKWHGR